MSCSMLPLQAIFEHAFLMAIEFVIDVQSSTDMFWTFVVLAVKLVFLLIIIFS